MIAASDLEFVKSFTAGRFPKLSILLGLGAFLKEKNALFLEFIQYSKYFQTDRGGGEIKRNSACDEEKLDNLAKRDQQKSSLALGPHYGLSGCELNKVLLRLGNR